MHHVVQALAAAEAPVHLDVGEVGPARPRVREEEDAAQRQPCRGATSGISTHWLALPRSERVPSRAAMRTW